MWSAHDGRHFGIQTIVDQNYMLRPSFVKRAGGNHGGDWTALIEAEPLVSCVTIRHRLPLWPTHLNSTVGRRNGIF